MRRNLYSISELAGMFELTEGTLKRWVKRGCPVEIGEDGRELYDLEDVVDWRISVSRFKRGIGV